MISHIDLDCFFVSCERIKNPTLIGKPVIVGGNATSRGVVSSASYEARKFGVRSAMPTAQAKRLCPQGIFLSPDFDTYSKLSDQVGYFLREAAPVVEQASIDEFYLDLTGCSRIYPDLRKFGTFVKDYLKIELKLPASIAIASNKLVSKIAIEQAKPDGFIQVESGKEAAFLASLPIRAMPGIGQATEREMQKLGFKTLGQIAVADESFLRRHFGGWGLEFKKSALGVDDRPVVSWEDPKSIGRETTFERDTSDPEYLLSILSSFIEECCAELRRYQFRARTVSVKFRLPDFTPLESHSHDKADNVLDIDMFKSNSFVKQRAKFLTGFTTFERSKTIPATHDETEIYKVVEKLFLKHLGQNMKLRLIGTSVSNLTSFRPSKELFADLEREKREQIAKQMDQIRVKYGFESIHLGSSLRVFGKDG